MHAVMVAVKTLASALTALALTKAAVGFELGGPCIDPNTRTAQDFVTERQSLMHPQRLALKAGDYSTAIQLQKDIVRMQCENDYRWLYLAELLLDAKRYREVVEVLSVLYDREFNELEERLAEEQHKFHALLNRPEFLESRLNGRIAENEAEFRERHRMFASQLADLDATARPPRHYVAKDVCPFECCQYGSWSVSETTLLYDQPHGTMLVGRALEGEQVVGLTGEVHVLPAPIAVLVPVESYQPPLTVAAGEIVFQLDYLGEGLAHVWRNGTVTEMEVRGVVKAYCPFPAPDCWGEYVRGEPLESDYAWWVKVRIPNGNVGWTKEIAFDGMSGCG